MVYLKVDGDKWIEDVSFVGKGCAISVASASMMTELVKGRTIDEVQTMFERFHEMCTGDDSKGNSTLLDDDLEKLNVLSGVRAFPVRVKCATLPWHTLNAAIDGKDEASTEA